MNCSKGDVVLFPYPFSDLTTKKVRPAVVVSAMGKQYLDVFIVPLTSKTKHLEEGEFIISRWEKAGFRGCNNLAIYNIVNSSLGFGTKL